MVQDVAKVIVEILEKNIEGKILEIGGEEILSFRKILEMILEELELKRKLIIRTFGLSKKLAFLLEIMPNPILTMDQVELLKKDNIISKK